MVDCVVIVSGGMDSVTLLHQLVKREQLSPAVITFAYGQKHAREIDDASFQAGLLQCEPHLVLDLSSLKPLFASSALVASDLAVPTIDEVSGDPQPSTYVPNRNMLFLAMAVAFAESVGCSDLYYGAQRHDMYGYWDTTPEFLARLNQVYRLNRKLRVTIHAPLVDYTKSDILALGMELGVDYGRTWSCYEGAQLACGRCPTCAERLQAFEAVGVADPLPYA
jgi:7-cyano-7-deazaguanine synthase